MSQPDPGTGNESIADVSDWNRFLLAVGVFLILESVLITAFGSSMYGDPDPRKLADPDGMSSTVFFILALLGYFLLGLIARSWVVLMIAFLPLVITFAVGVPSDAGLVHREPLPLFFLWGVGMIYFLPACAIGVGVSKWVTRGLRVRAEDDPGQVG